MLAPCCGWRSATHPRPDGRTPLREGTAGADAIYVADWYLRPLSERGGRREADGVCLGCNRRVCAGAVRHTPRPSGRTPLREGTAGAYAIYVADWYLRPLSERGGRREADGVCPGCNHSVRLAPCDTPPALRAYPSPRGDVLPRRGGDGGRRSSIVLRSFFARSSIRIEERAKNYRRTIEELSKNGAPHHLPYAAAHPLSERGTPAGRGVCRTALAPMGGCIRDTPRPPDGGHPSPRGDVDTNLRRI